MSAAERNTRYSPQGTSTNCPTAEKYFWHRSARTESSGALRVHGTLTTSLISAKYVLQFASEPETGVDFSYCSFFSFCSFCAPLGRGWMFATRPRAGSIRNARTREATAINFFITGSSARRLSGPSLLSPIGVSCCSHWNTQTKFQQSIYRSNAVAPSSALRHRMCLPLVGRMNSMDFIKRLSDKRDRGLRAQVLH